MYLQSRVHIPRHTPHTDTSQHTNTCPPPSSLVWGLQKEHLASVVIGPGHHTLGGSLVHSDGGVEALWGGESQRHQPDAGDNRLGAGGREPRLEGVDDGHVPTSRSQHQQTSPPPYIVTQAHPCLPTPPVHTAALCAEAGIPPNLQRWWVVVVMTVSNHSTLVPQNLAQVPIPLPPSGCGQALGQPHCAPTWGRIQSYISQKLGLTQASALLSPSQPPITLMVQPFPRQRPNQGCPLELSRCI